MSRLSERFARIVRVRTIEHRVAMARQADAERRVVDLLGIAQRIGTLRSSLNSRQGMIDGQSLKAMSEMHSRLGRAEGDLAQPISQAEATHEQASFFRLAARNREDGAERLRDRATAGEESAAVLREDANRIHRTASRRRA